MTDPLIRAKELHGLLGAPGVRIVDASYNLPPASIGIAGAVDFDIDDIADPSAPLAHTLPSPEIFAEKVGALGISNRDTVIVYDRAGIHMAAARVWWMFRVFGHDNVRVLDGGLPAWAAAGFPVELKSAEPPKPAEFIAHFRPELFKTKQNIQDNLSARSFQVLDARDPSRYAGTAPEPRPGIESGHIPGSLNTPFAGLIDPATGLMREPKALADILEDTVKGKPLAISCGSGVTACVVALGLHRIGRKDAAIYGGSWTEWGGSAETPKKKGMEP